MISDTVTLSFLAEGPMVMRIGLQTISGNHHASHVLLRLVTRLRHPQHVGGIWSGLMPYRLPFDTLSEYPEPWLQQTRGSLS